ncbi:GAF and ANTAR domain-containing protein [Pseudarthrobacter sulfonivorans]|uniref:GAF and ANTAR domain-containing protein n=1 Tax=Pseudarthrobacter sulfonivorans TaxID=121292 RepID=UPI002102C743|nr:GAF and ANTAR domain-containing protein [Pseudarthrobacter sulfonivorans]
MLIEQHLTWRGSGAGALLDIHGHSEAALAGSLAQLVATSLSDLSRWPVESTVTLVRPDGTPRLGTSTEGAAVDLSRWDQRTGAGPTARALRGRLSIILNDRAPDPRWPEYCASLTAAGYRSAVAIPLPLEGGHSAALTLYSRTANTFAPGVATKVLVFSGIAAKSLRLALKHRADLALSAEHRAALASSTAINTACGVLMGQNNCSYESAHRLLLQESKQRNLTIREVAEGLLQVLPGGIPASHFTARA